MTRIYYSTLSYVLALYLRLQIYKTNAKNSLLLEFVNVCHMHARLSRSYVCRYQFSCLICNLTDCDILVAYLLSIHLTLQKEHTFFTVKELKQSFENANN